PALRLLKEADGGPRLAEMGIAVGPGTDQALARHLEAGEKPQDRVGIAVGPAADRIDRALDGRVVLADRPVLPVGVAPLPAHPLLGPQAGVLEPRQPGVAPALADHLGRRG